MKFLRNLIKVVIVLAGLFIITYLLGPKVSTPNLDKTLPETTISLTQLEAEIQEREASFQNIKPDNEARIIWADSVPAKTEYSIVYLHGWSASQEEGDPIHMETAKRFGCNLYLPRLAGHGLTEEEPMLDLTADQLLQSAKEAIAVGKQLGQKVIVMGTSTGGTLALHLAGGNSDIAALLLYSPNVEIYDASSKLLAKPWGLQLARIAKGGDYHEFDQTTPLKDQYWTTKYRLEALTHLQVLVDETMTEETFSQITQPVFLGYFFKNDSVQDKIVSVPAMLEMYDDLGTLPEKKEKVAFPETGDHVMTSYITSKDLESVKDKTFRFLEKVIQMKPVPEPATMESGLN